MARRPLIAGNWKMNGTFGSLGELDLIAAHLAGVEDDLPDVVLCPPMTLVAAAAGMLRGTPVAVGGQDCHVETKGAHTGDIAAPMLTDAGARYCILGHSERRADHGEDNGLIAAKALAAKGSGLIAIICVGETEGERDHGHALDVIGAQLAGSVPDGATAINTVIAYEPVWAIGTGRTPTDDEIVEVHSFIRRHLVARFGETVAGGLRILYGGSVKATNALTILKLKDVDGALVGGASLKAADFCPIIDAAR